MKTYVRYSVINSLNKLFNTCDISDYNYYVTEERLVNFYAAADSHNDYQTTYIFFIGAYNYPTVNYNGYNYDVYLIVTLLDDGYYGFRIQDMHYIIVPIFTFHDLGALIKVELYKNEQICLTPFDKHRYLLDILSPKILVPTGGHQLNETLLITLKDVTRILTANNILEVSVLDTNNPADTWCYSIASKHIVSTES